MSETPLEKLERDIADKYFAERMRGREDEIKVWTPNEVEIGKYTYADGSPVKVFKANREQLKKPNPTE